MLYLCRNGMSTLILEYECLVQKLTFTDDSFIVFLNDGRSISIPLTWYPRLFHAKRCELENYEFIGLILMKI